MREHTAHPELGFLLACCAQVPEAERQERVRVALAGPLNWDGVVAIAERHGLIPRVYQALAATSTAPPAILDSAYVANCKSTLWFAAELARVTKHLQQHGIATLAYKGPVLSQLLYGSVCERQFHDLDLMVQTNHVAAAKKALGELGYHSRLALTARQERDYLRTGYEYAMDLTPEKNVLELHWQTQPRFYAMDFSVRDFFQRSVTIQIAGQPVRTLCREDLMLVLCAHAAKHLWMRLSLLTDIAQLAQCEDLNWMAVQAQAAELGLRRIIAVSFLLAQYWLSYPLPEVVEPDESAKAVTEEISTIHARHADFDMESSGYFRLMLQLRERPFDKGRFLWRLLTTPGTGEWEAVRLPDALFPLYRVVRIGRLVKRGLSASL